MVPKTKKNFSSTIKLGPAIGDWTKIEPNQRPIEAANIREIKRPNFDSLPQADVRYLHLLHYRMAERILNKLSEDLNIKTELHSISATQLSGEDFKEYLNEPLIQFDLHLKSVGTLNFIIDPTLGEVLVNRMTGSDDPIADIGKAFTDLDDSILSSQVEEFIPIFSEMWKQIFEPQHIHYQSQFGSYIFDDKFTDRDAYVFFGFYFTIGYSDVLRFIIAYPSSIIRKLLRYHQRVVTPMKRRVRLLPKTLQSIQVKVSAELGSSEIIMSDLKSLEPGDIITLDSKIEDPVKVTLGSSRAIMGQAGVSRNRVCVQLLNQEELDDVQALDSMDQLIDENSKDLLPSHFTEKATQFTEDDHTWGKEPQMIASPIKGVVNAGTDASLVDDTDDFSMGSGTPGLLFDDLSATDPSDEDDADAQHYNEFDDDNENDDDDDDNSLMEANAAIDDELDDDVIVHDKEDGDDEDFGFNMPEIPDEELREQEEAMAMAESEMAVADEALPNSEGLQDLVDYDEEDEQTFGSAAKSIPALGLEDDDEDDELDDYQELALPVTASTDALPPPITSDEDDDDNDDFSWDDLDD